MILFHCMSGGSKIKFHLIDNFLYFLLSFGKPQIGYNFKICPTKIEFKEKKK